MSIESCYLFVVQKLTNDQNIEGVSRQFLSLTSNSERVLYVYEIIDSLEAFPELNDVQKSDDASTFYRNQGNQSFKNKDDHRAWHYYNLSLVHSPLTSENYVLALANRSAVFYSLNLFKECVNDIEKVFLCKYPERIKDKLTNRLKLCQETLSKQPKNNVEEIINRTNILTFKGQKQITFPCASTKLEVLFSEEMGRHVIAKEDIKVGEVLVEEDPYLTLLVKDQYLISCSYCLSRNLNLLPCQHCCYSFFCSPNCEEKAWKDYHSVECNLMAALMDLKFTQLELLALRTTIKARLEQSDWNSVFQVIQKAESNLNNKYRGQVKIDNKWVYDSKYYTSIHTLSSNFEKRDVSDKFQKSVTAAVFLYMLMKKTSFLNCESEEQKEDIKSCVAGLLLLHGFTSPTNIRGLNTNKGAPDGNFPKEVSLSPYAFHSLLNHSCAPNVFRFEKVGTGRMSLFALRPIKKGMQLYDNYGAHHAMEDRLSRQENLKFQYKFTCLCEACANDWPTHQKLQQAKNLPLEVSRKQNKLLNSNTLEKLQKGDRGMALELFKPLCKLAEVLEPYAPCLELSNCQEALKQCLTIIQGFVPYAYSKLIKWKPRPPS